MNDFKPIAVDKKRTFELAAAILAVSDRSREHAVACLLVSANIFSSQISRDDFLKFAVDCWDWAPEDSASLTQIEQRIPAASHVHVWRVSGMVLDWRMYYRSPIKITGYCSQCRVELALTPLQWRHIIEHPLSAVKVELL